MKARSMDREHRKELKMAEEEPSQVSTAMKIRQTISVPFVWEVIPGTPKKDWRPTPPPPSRPRAPPVKLIASVPFGWEERPGKPLPHCSQPTPSSAISLQQAESNSIQSPVQLTASVPFEWKEKPGKPLPCSSQPPPASSPVVLPKAETSFPSPVKLIASVPFEWEEKPGKPLPCSSQPPPASSPVVLPKVETSFPSPVKLIASVPFEWEEKPGKSLPFLQPPSSSPLALSQVGCNSSPSFPGLSEGNRDNRMSRKDQDGNESEMLESDSETCEYETDDGSFTSRPSFSANNLTQTMAAVPLRQTSPKDLNSGQLQSPGSPASETGSTSSYATGTTSLVGASFLERLFPLLTPHSSFLDKVGCSESVSQIQSKKQSIDFHQERNYAAAIRGPTTLGELIMMSRRRSYQRKAIQMQKNLSKEIMKRNTMGCGIFGTRDILGRFGMKWKRQLQLKFV